MEASSWWRERMLAAERAFEQGDAARAAAILLEMHEVSGPNYRAQTYGMGDSRKCLARAVELARDGLLERAEALYRAALPGII